MIEDVSVSQVRALLMNAKRVLCLCHRNPDGDAVGSLLGVGLSIEKNYSEKQVLFCCKDPAPQTFHFLPGVMRIQALPLLQEGDAIVFLDSAEPSQTGLQEERPELFDGSYPSINIDHHPKNPGFGKINIVVPEAASSCEIVFALTDALGWQVDADIATCLLTGVYTDTGGLVHSNTTAAVYRTVGRLLRIGARQQEVIQQVYRTSKMSSLKLWGRVLEKISITPEGAAISAVTRGDFLATGAEYSELTGAIDYLNAVPGMKFSMLLSERDGKVKGSLRTLRDDVDVSEMAGKFQGGGHKKAAGFTVPGKLEKEIRWKVIEESE